MEPEPLQGARPLSSPEGGGKGEHPQSAPRAVICRHGFGGAHIQRCPEANKSEPAASSHCPTRRVRHSPGRALPGAAPEAAGNRVGGERRNRPFTPQALPQSTRERRGSPRGCAGGQGDAMPHCPAGRRGRPGRGSGTARSRRRRRAAALSSPSRRPLPCPPRARQPWPLARPAGAPPSLSPVEPRRCRAAAITRAKTRPPRRHPPPQRGNAAAAGVCERKESGGQWGAKRWPRVRERERGRGVTGLRPGCTTPCPASPLTRGPGSPAPCRPARSAGSGDSLRSAPLPTPPPPAPAPGLAATRHGGAGDPPPPPSRNSTGEGVGTKIIAVNNHTRSAAVPFSSSVSKRAAR
ncbi:uncharacterized protein [Taeniopygia guttata]|uniref:uncharacterized protein n=1 Tax=Taeniopygia guttata TaxID=59729 RepID=UPI003BB9938C